MNYVLYDAIAQNEGDTFWLTTATAKALGLHDMIEDEDDEEESG